MNCRGNTNRSPLRIFDDKYLDRPISTIGEVPLTLSTDRNLYSVPVIPGTTVLSSKVISTPPVKTIPQAIPSASTAEKTLTYRYEGSQYSTINRIGEETIRREIITNSIEPNYELNPAHTSFLDKIKASIPFLSAKKEPEEEQKEVIREVGEIQTIEQTEQHPDFMERVKGLINRVEDKLGSALCSGSTNTIDVGERRERTSFKDKIMNTCPLIKDKIESTAVQVPEYEPELYVTSTDALARDYTTQEEPIAGKMVESGQTYQGREFEVNREIRPVERIINVESNLPHYRNVETMHLSNENSIPVQQLQSRTVERRYARPYSLYSESNGLGTRVLEVRRLDRSSQNLPSERLEEGMLHYEA